MRSLLFASTIGAAYSLSVATSKKPAVQALMESARGMLKNGATTQVEKFAEETLKEVSDIVIPAIISESENDQEFLDKLFERFEEIEKKLETGNKEISQLNKEEKEDSEEHKACRADEHTKCYGEDGKRECEKSMYALWETWVSEEEKLKDIHDIIYGHFCPPEKGGPIPNGTTHEFRVTSKPEMERYMAQKEVAEKALKAYDVHVPLCRDAHTTLDKASSGCNLKQTTLEEKACEHRQKIHEVAERFWGDYAQAEAAYTCAAEEVMHLQKDRHQEWVTLQVVQCLLEEIHNQNGVPCDTTTEVDERVVKCEKKHETDVCATEPLLCLKIKDVPEKPDPCPNRDSVTGYCIAKEIPTPCCAAWQNQEIKDLPPFPVAPFSHENPGCNARPECTDCTMEPVPEYKSVDTCPGYTVDGCKKNNAKDEEHPLTLIRSVDGLADVRCCKDEVDLSVSCKSQGFEGGVDFKTPGDGDGKHTQCYFDVSYQEAMKVCHAAGMRICTHEEMEDNTCCDTGCWHNHHAIWVDVQNPLDLDRPQVYSVTHDQHMEYRANRDNATHEDYVEHREGIMPKSK